MNLSIRHWLVENDIEISKIAGLSQTQITGIALRIIRDTEARTPLPFDICTLAEVLEFPLGVVWHYIPVFSSLTRSILELLAQKKPLLRNEATWLAFQVAYLQALEEVLIEEESLSRVWLQRALVSVGDEEMGRWKVMVKPLWDEHLQASLKILRRDKLTEVQGEEALYKIKDSSFIQQINGIAVAWLVANSVPKAEAQLIIQRLENKFLGHLIAVVSENSATLVQLQKFLKLGNKFEIKTTINQQFTDEKIDYYKDIYRVNLIKKVGEPLLIESFCLQDIYVPPRGLPLQENHQGVDLMNWVVSQLEDLETIAVIESESGYGKTCFCEMFAARIAQNFYPDWIPVFISLSKVNYGKTFQESLASATLNNWKINISNWLEEPNNRCLLILDGLNELPYCGENKTSIAIFLQQLFEFHSQKRHKIILTAQSWVLEDITSKAASILRRIQIQPWEQDEWKQWFGNWAKVQSMTVAQNYFTFLKRNKSFSQKYKFLLSDLVRQPLMLYLLAILHRDQLFDDEILQLATNPQNTNNSVVLWHIYERLHRWLLGYPVSPISQKILTSSLANHIHRTPTSVTCLLKNRHPQELIDQMQAVALQILCSGKKNIHLKDDLISLPAFYFRRVRHTQNINSRFTSPPIANSIVEFSHSKLGEYLCASSIVAQLKALTTATRNAYSEMIFADDSPHAVAEKLYYLLGYGILTQEIEELIIEGLRKEHTSKFSFELLCSRLQPFWYAYCGGRWLDEGIAHKAWTYFKELQNPINVEQVNAAVGINVFLLLSASYRQTKQTFSPCQNPASLTEFHPQALIKLIAKTAFFNPKTTRRRIAKKSLTFLNLSKADLTQAMLAQVNFTNTDLSNVQLKDACLLGANLAEANLTGADLTGANLKNANLTNAKLTGANLTGANLLGVNLDVVNLSNACLFQAILTEADKETAVANGAVFSLDKFKELQRLLSYQSQIHNKYTGEQTEIVYKENSSIGRIESAEGEPILPVDLDDDTEDETVLGTTDF